MRHKDGQWVLVKVVQEKYEKYEYGYLRKSVGDAGEPEQPEKLIKSRGNQSFEY